MGLSTEDETRYKGNVKAMLELLSASGKSALWHFVLLVLLTSTIMLLSTLHADIMLWVMVVINIISARGLSGMLTSLCDPYTVVPYKNKLKLTDVEFMNIYANLKRPQFIIGIQWIAYAIEVYAIIVYANMFYAGLIWLVTCVLLENSIHNSNQKMKSLWAEQLAYDRSTSD